MKQSLAIITALALSATAAAQPAPAEPIDSPELARAKQMYVEGKRYYDVGDYSRAIETWKRAYVVSSAPMLLFNIAQAYRLSGDCVQALRVYGNYERESPDPPNKDELEQAKARCNREPTATNPPAPTTGPTTTGPTATGATSPTITTATTTSSATRAPARAPNSDGRTLRIAGIATSAAGAGLVVTSVVLALRASDRADRVSDFRGEWTTEQRALEREGQRARTWSIVTGVAGGAALVGGAVLYYAGHRAQRAHVDVALTPSHAEVQWSVSF